MESSVCGVKPFKRIAKPLWVDGVFSCDYELDTLPLLFSSLADFDLYYSALVTKHKNHSKEILRIRQCSLTARVHRETGNYDHCLQVLSKGLHLRRSIFDDADYQCYAGVAHYLLTILYLAASHLASQDLTSAFTFFSRAQKELAEYRPFLTRSDNSLLRTILYSNWANYWVKRKRYNAASQCCCKAYQLWMRSTDLSRNVLAYLCPFLVARFAASLLLTGKEKDAAKVYAQYLAVLPLEGEEGDSRPVSSAGGSRPGTASTDGGGGAMTVNITTISLQEPGEGAPQSTCCLRSLSISLTPFEVNEAGDRDGSTPTPVLPVPPTGTNWPLHQSSAVASYCNYGLASYATRQYKQSALILDKAVSVFEHCSESTRTPGNPYWWRQIRSALVAAQQATQVRTQGDFRMKAEDSRRTDILDMQRLLIDEAQKVLAQGDGEEDKSDDEADVEQDQKEAAKVWRGLVKPILMEGTSFKQALSTLQKRDPNARPLSATDGLSHVRMLASHVAKKRREVRRSQFAKSVERAQSVYAGANGQGQRGRGAASATPHSSHMHGTMGQPRAASAELHRGDDDDDGHPLPQRTAHTERDGNGYDVACTYSIAGSYRGEQHIHADHHAAASKYDSAPAKKAALQPLDPTKPAWGPENTASTAPGLNPPSLKIPKGSERPDIPKSLIKNNSKVPLNGRLKWGSRKQVSPLEERHQKEQSKLRAALTHIDVHSSLYSMALQEMAANEKQFIKDRREEVKRERLKSKRQREIEAARLHGTYLDEQIESTSPSEGNKHVDAPTQLSQVEEDPCSPLGQSNLTQTPDASKQEWEMVAGILEDAGRSPLSGPPPPPPIEGEPIEEEGADLSLLNIPQEELLAAGAIMCLMLQGMCHQQSHPQPLPSPSDECPQPHPNTLTQPPLEGEGAVGQAPLVTPSVGETEVELEGGDSKAQMVVGPNHPLDPSLASVRVEEALGESALPLMPDGPIHGLPGSTREGPAPDQDEEREPGVRP